MSCIVLFILFLLIFLISFSIGDSYCWRSSFMSASVCWGVSVTLVTEMSTFWVVFDYSHLLKIYLMMNVATITLLILVVLRQRGQILSAGKESLVGSFDSKSFLILASIFVILLFTLCVACFAPPNNWDSMTYHMARVANWIQNKSVAFYPTHITRQLHSNPFAEYVISNLGVLSGGDHFANLVQWFSMFGSVIGVSLIARNIGTTRDSQIFASVFAVTLPMGILQATSTQNDYVVTFWVVGFIIFGLNFAMVPNAFNTFLGGAALGLAILTKATACVYAFPFFLWVAVASIRSHKWKGLIGLSFMSLIIVLINAPHSMRNVQTWGSLQGDPGVAKMIVNEDLSLQALASNLSRNFLIHVQQPSEVSRAALNHFAQKFHDVLGISCHDPKTTFPGTKFEIPPINTHEDMAGNPLHLMLFLASLLIYIKKGSFRRRSVTFYLLSCLTTIVLFNGYLKWQPWHSRLHLPIFVLLAPYVGIVMTQFTHRAVAPTVMAILLVFSLPTVVCNSSRPIISPVNYSFNTKVCFDSIFCNDRITNMFRNKPESRLPYLQAIEYIKGMDCKSVGLVTGGDDWEYPLWVIIARELGSNVSVIHVMVNNTSRKYAEELGTNVCAIVRLGTSPEKFLEFNGNSYSLQYTKETINVYERIDSMSGRRFGREAISLLTIGLRTKCES